MKYLIITQVFYPDTVSVSQHLSDLAFELVKNGNKVTVFTSVFPYEEKSFRYPAKECIRGVEIFRLSQTAFGKKNTLFRLLDFMTFYLNSSLKLLSVKKNEYDIIIGTTVPPLLSFIGVLIAKWKKYKFVYWVMDLQPELSISSGLIKVNSLPAKFFTRLGNYIIKNSNHIVSLDRFMTEYLISRGAIKNNISTIPVWPVLDEVYTGGRLTNPFRVENKFGDRVVIMYSGNHAFVHPLNTLLEAALKLRGDDRFLFVFVGGGVRKKDVTDFKKINNLDNILQLPFQPREQIHLSLGSSDLQVVILGDGQVGYTHPNKVYGALYIGKPILYIGPQRSHVSDIINTIEGNIAVEHGQVKVLVEKLLDFVKKSENTTHEIGYKNQKYAQANLHPDILKQKMIDAVNC
jgi:hypothetical protein